MTDLPGQISTPLADGGLVLSASRTIEEGARAALLLAPGWFRLDVTPHDDTIKLHVRNLSDGPCFWADGGAPHVELAIGGPSISAHTLRIDLGGRRVDVVLSITRDTAAGRMGLVGQAVLAPR